MRPGRPTNRRRITDYACILSQIATAMNAITMVAQTAGPTCFELPLRGESFGGMIEFGAHRLIPRRTLQRKTARTLSQRDSFS